MTLMYKRFRNMNSLVGFVNSKGDKIQKFEVLHDNPPTRGWVLMYWIR